ncbi:DEAD/DEAH box helicase [bacterium]|nr:DEAD/DEAH box helicase [bacterium]
MSTIGFQDFGLSEEMVLALKEKGFVSPTEIQVKVIPELLKERCDLIGQAQTGTGKTAAFAIPILERIRSNGEVKALILAPTRELAIQVSDEIYSLKGRKNLRTMPVYGGQSIEQQIKKIKKGVDIIVGTPGRIMDLMERGILFVDSLEYFVLDEADEMLNMGFVDDIEKILEATNSDKKMLFFSATIPDSIMEIAHKYMSKPKVIKVAAKELTTELTEQIYFEVKEEDKFETLCRVLDFKSDFYGIVFCQTKIESDEIAGKLKERGYDAEALNGDLSQVIRLKILSEFKSRIIRILVATDVASRGLDVQNLTHVINYSIPKEAESYVHRIGRTGRAGQKGIAITFVTPKESFSLQKIQRVTKTGIKKEHIPRVQEVIQAKKELLYACVKEIHKEDDHKKYISIARELLDSLTPEDAIASLLRHIYDDDFLPENYTEIEEVRFNVEDKVRLFVALGKKDGFTPVKLLDLLNQKAKTPGRKVRDIKIFDTYSFITVPLQEAEYIMRALNKHGDSKKPLVEKASPKTSDGGDFKKKTDKKEILRPNSDRKNSNFSEKGRREYSTRKK